MWMYSRIQIDCRDVVVSANECSLEGTRHDGRTTVVIYASQAELVLSEMSADQIDAIASDLRTIAQDMRVGHKANGSDDTVADVSDSAAPFTVLAECEQVTLGECRLADHVVLGNDNVHWTVISGKRQEGYVWVRNTKTADRLLLPSARMVTRVK